MPIDASYAGRCYPATAPYEVTRERIRAFADAIGDDQPAYHDPDASAAFGHREVVAPPTFATVVLGGALAALLTDPDAGLALARVVHADQRFVHSRPLVAGDVVVATLTVESVRPVGAADRIGVRTDIDTVGGERVCRASTTLLHHRLGDGE